MGAKDYRKSRTIKFHAVYPIPIKERFIQKDIDSSDYDDEDTWNQLHPCNDYSDLFSEVSDKSGGVSFESTHL